MFAKVVAVTTGVSRTRLMGRTASSVSPRVSQRRADQRPTDPAVAVGEGADGLELGVHH